MRGTPACRSDDGGDFSLVLLVSLDVDVAQLVLRRRVHDRGNSAGLRRSPSAHNIRGSDSRGREDGRLLLPNGRQLTPDPLDLGGEAGLSKPLCRLTVRDHGL
jgi:hypothetical protein